MPLRLHVLLNVFLGLNLACLRAAQLSDAWSEPGPAGLGRSLLDATCTYTVVSGDFAYEIASDRGCTLDDLQAANPGVNLETLDVGQSLNLPEACACTAAAAPAGAQGPADDEPGIDCTYEVVSGDNAYAIATERGCTVDDLQEANPGVDLEMLDIGQTLNLPEACGCLAAYGPADGPIEAPVDPDAKCAYMVYEGDYAYMIAQQRNCTLEDLARANPGIDLENLMDGQYVILPEPCVCISADAPASAAGPLGAVAPADAPLPDDPCMYVVVTGDYTQKIAIERGCKWQDIADANPDMDPDMIFPGDVLALPPACGCDDVVPAPAPAIEPVEGPAAGPAADPLSPDAIEPPANTESGPEDSAATGVPNGMLVCTALVALWLLS